MSAQTPSTRHLPVIFLMGATACGKTALSVSLAQQLDAEIVSVDSALVYRGMDIGTAKPSLAEQAGIAHHLIDICDVWDAYSAARFVEDASKAIDEIQARGKRVLLVGGTMLYFKALEQGLALLPEADEHVRKTLLNEAAVKGWTALHRELEQIDPTAASRIHPNDTQRLQRALEVYRLTGHPMSELQADTHSALALPSQKFALAPQNRAWLHQRIERRFSNMLESGFMAEMHRLRSDSRIQGELPAMRSVGYRQAWEYLETLRKNTAEYTHDTNVPQIQPAGGRSRVSDDEPTVWIDKAIAATRQLAKRQLTWLRHMQDVTMLACDTLSLAEQEKMIVMAVQKAAHKPLNSENTR